jgi:catechol 2,3-dioxygenase-like lactoylglutathione lyase family enzyme
MPPTPPTAAALRRALILAADVPAAARFYSEGLGLGVAALTERWADLRGPGGRPALAIKAADR